MYKKKGLFIIICIALIFNACGQKTNKNMDNKIKDKVLNIYKQVKVFDYNPRFVLDFSAFGCTYQVLVNDVPVMNSNEPGDVGGAVYPFSEYVLHSGKQDITIRLFPAMRDGYVRDSFLTARSRMKLKVLEGDFHRQKPDDYKVLLQLETPEIVKDTLPYLEIKGSFTTTLPKEREIDGWSKGVDLSKEDKDKLLKEVVAKYEEFRQCFVKKDVYLLADILYKRQLDFAKTYFQNKPEQSEEIWNKFEDMINPVIKVFNLENDKLVIYGNGKITALDRIDLKFERESIVKTETENRFEYYSILLYRPAPDAPLEVIR